MGPLLLGRAPCTGGFTRGRFHQRHLRAFDPQNEKSRRCERRLSLFSGGRCLCCSSRRRPESRSAVSVENTSATPESTSITWFIPFSLLSSGVSRSTVSAGRQ